MPYKKSYRKRYPRRYRKGTRRFYKKMGKKKYDGAAFFKIHMTGDISHDSTYGHADFTVNWCGNGSALATPTVMV